MITPKGPKVIEYNCRFGDPETQVVLPRLKTDIVDIFEAIDNETLSDLDVEWSDDACACVIMASGGYPKSYPKGIEITGLSNGQLDGVTVTMRELSFKITNLLPQAAEFWALRHSVILLKMH